MVPREKPRSYYGRPIVKPPVWTWEIPAYFFVGGTAGAAATLADVADRRGNDELARTAWGVALAGVTISPMLLISDLGRPARFLNMLRVFKVTSPMSVGSWILALNGVLIAPAALASLFGRPSLLGRLSGRLAAFAGPALSTYTAVLIANSAIPAWSEARRHLPFLFAAGSAASAGAATGLLTKPEAAGPARRLAVTAALAEVAVAERMERALRASARPYTEGRAGGMGRAAKALSAAGAVTLAIGSRRRVLRAAGAGMVLAGAGLERWAIVAAGRAAAADPALTVDLQRSRAGG